ncbi:MAG: flavin reductase [Bacteroidetes bacterium 4572_77]|nr:MAG: flavin reductase [Bacteroidetes bacterium 4572_77]
MEKAKIKNGKLQWPPGNMVYPIPAVMLSCGSKPEEYNIITIAWTGTLNSNPPMVYASIRKSRHSYDLVRKSGEFVINLTTKDLAFQTDWCGVRSGRDYNKFKSMKLSSRKGEKVEAPIIIEAPVNIECKVLNEQDLGSHSMFMAEVVHIQADEKYLDQKTGSFELFRSNPLVYSHGHYYELGKHIGKFGFSVMSEKAKKKQLKVDFNRRR